MKSEVLEKVVQVLQYCTVCPVRVAVLVLRTVLQVGVYCTGIQATCTTYMYVHVCTMIYDIDCTLHYYIHVCTPHTY